ncbi:helix-turn-helix domain-containing protein [Roseibium sp.]|uniref:helix-turn-helix domain-containing protein n=1 Tax=Roseibium sp. TaxID=1936156 RepID=UPI003D10E3F8
MNIRAKISQPVATGPAAASESVNAPLGEAYSAYWNWWLSRFAGEAVKRYPDVYGLETVQAGTHPDPMDRIARLYVARGCDAIFGLARALGRPSGFDVASFLITGTGSIPDLVRKWSGFVGQQSAIRFQAEGRENGFIEREDDFTLVLSPYNVRPANQKPFGPAMLAGVAAGTLEGAGYEIEAIWSVTRTGHSKPLLRFGMFLGERIEFDSDIVIRLSQKRRPLASGAVPGTLSLYHLMRPEVGPAGARLLSKLVSHMEVVEGEHPTLATAATSLGLSARSLSRRLHEAGLGYGRLTRFVRLRKATRLIAVSPQSLDEIAYVAAYSDRHHMARDFRRMAQVTPAGLRDLLKG